MGIFDAFKGFDWNPDSGDIVDPPSAVKNTGWKLLDIPPAEYFNWFWSRVSAAFQRIADTQIPLLRTRDECVSDDMQGRVFCYQPEDEAELKWELDFPVSVSKFLATDGANIILSATSETRIAKPSGAVVTTIPRSSSHAASDGQVIALIDSFSPGFEVTAYQTSPAFAQMGVATFPGLNVSAPPVVLGEHVFTLTEDVVPNVYLTRSTFLGAIDTPYAVPALDRAHDLCGFGGMLYAVGDPGSTDSVVRISAGNPGTQNAISRGGKKTHACATDGDFLYVCGEPESGGEQVAIYPLLGTFGADARKLAAFGAGVSAIAIGVDDRFLYVGSDAGGGTIGLLYIFDKASLQPMEQLSGSSSYKHIASDAWGVILYGDSDAQNSRRWLPGHHTGFKRMLNIPDPTVERLPATRTPFNHAVLPVR